jgi:hypothetical protein
MRKRYIGVLKRSPVMFLIAVLLALMTVPASAGRDPVGDRLGLVIPCLFASPVSHDIGAGDPFYVSHGYILDPNAEEPVSKFKFDLWVDDVHQKAKLHVIAIEPSSGPFEEDEAFLERRYVTTFPDGFSGTHEFRALWTTPDGVDPGFGSPLDCTWNINFP